MENEPLETQGKKTKTQDGRDSLCGNLNVFDTHKLKLNCITKCGFLRVAMVLVEEVCYYAGRQALRFPVLKVLHCDAVHFLLPLINI